MKPKEQETRKLRFWKQIELNQFNRDLLEWTIELCLKVLPEKPDERYNHIAVKMAMARKAQKGMNTGLNFTESLWGRYPETPINHSWVIVCQDEYTTILQGLGIRPGEKIVGFHLKNDHSIQPLLTYPVEDCKQSMLKLMSLDPEKAHSFYMYNLVTGQEQRPYMPETHPPIHEPIPDEPLAIETDEEPPEFSVFEG